MREEMSLENGKTPNNNSTVVESGIISEQLYDNLKHTISRVLEYMGRYQFALCIAFLFNGWIYGINHNLPAFHIYTPTFFCKENGDMPNSCENLNGACPSGFRFNDDDHTVVTEWSLVCGKRLLAPMVNTLYYCGVTIGAIVNGILSDKYGRKKILLACLVCQGILGLLLRTTSIFELFIVMRTFQGFFVQGLQGSCVALLFEYSPSRLRTNNILMWHVMYSSGALILALISYGVRDWRMLQVMISIPTIVAVCFMWAVPESICWLYATNRKPKALNLCLRTATRNQDHKMIEEIKTYYVKELANVDVDVDEPSDDKVIIEKASLVDVVKTPSLRKHLLIMAVVNYSITVAYYGSIFFVNHLSGVRHVNYIIGSCAELVGLALLFFVLRQFGTRFTIILYLFVLAFLCAVIGLIIQFMPDTFEGKNTLVTTLSLIAKAVGLSTFTAKVLYNSELFPTICRGAAMGTCGFFARIGSVTAPFLMILTEYHSPLLPLGILSVLTLISATMVIFLPDTRNIILPHTISDSQELWEKKK